MSELRVSQQALAYLQSQIATREIVRPLVHVCWRAGTPDVTRGPQGEVLWQRDAARWWVSVIDDAEIYDSAVKTVSGRRNWLERKVESISGLRFILGGRANNLSMAGCTLDVLDEALFVREENQ